MSSRVLGLDLRSDPRTTAVGDLQDLRRLAGGLSSSDPSSVIDALNTLAQMEAAQILQVLRMMNPQLFAMLAASMFGSMNAQQQQPLDSLAPVGRGGGSGCR